MNHSIFDYKYKSFTAWCLAALSIVGIFVWLLQPILGSFVHVCLPDLTLASEYLASKIIGLVFTGQVLITGLCLPLAVIGLLTREAVDPWAKKALILWAVLSSATLWLFIILLTFWLKGIL